MTSPLRPASKAIGAGVYCAGVIVWAFAVLCITAQPAYAYVDPGSGLFLLQVISSTLIGIPFLIRKRIRQVCERFGKNRKKAPETNAPH
jgi:hypothetical protein